MYIWRNVSFFTNSRFAVIVKRQTNQQYDNEIFAAQRHKRNSQRTNGTFGFARPTSHPFAKPKEPFFAIARQTKILNEENRNNRTKQQNV